MEGSKLPIIKDQPGTIHAWSMYDWANSVYSLVIASAIFPAYYNTVTRDTFGSDIVEFLGFDIQNTAIYSITLGLSFGLIAISSPLLSSIADYTGWHKRFMRSFCYLGSLGCMLLFFFQGEQLLLGLGALMMATVGYAGSIVFYNAYLPTIASPSNQDRVSARGYAYGYIGSVFLLAINLAAILNQEVLGVTDGTLLSRLSFLLTGLWWFGFAHIPLAKLPDSLYREKRNINPLVNGYRQLIQVWDQLKEFAAVRRFLLAFFFYIMGVQTVMFMAASFGEKEIHMDISDLIITILIVELVGVVGAFLFAYISKKKGNTTGLMIAVSVWILICFGAIFIQTPVHFYIAGFFIGMVMGGIQSLSRSTYAKIIPRTHHDAGYFSFYDVCEKIAMMIGLIMFGYLDNLTGSMRNSVFTLGIFFAIGLIFLIRFKSIVPNSINSEA